MFFDSTLNVIERSLDYSMRRNDAISNNISNVDTPNYKAEDVFFRSILNAEINGLEAKKTDARHLPFTEDFGKINTFQQKNSFYNNNKNNVDIDLEMSKLAKNQIYYNSMIDRANGKFNNLKTVLRGGNS